jgi:hypothetical protein
MLLLTAKTRKKTAGAAAVFGLRKRACPWVRGE